MTESIPKALNKFNDRPLLSGILANLRSLGVPNQDIILVTGYKSELFAHFNLEMRVNFEWKDTGPFESLLTANDILEKYESVVIYTDIEFSVDYILPLMSNQSKIVIPSNMNFLASWGSRSINLLDDLESFKFEGVRLVEIGKRPSSYREVQGQFAGILKVNPEAWHSLREIGCSLKNKRLDITSLLSESIDRGLQIEIIPVYAPWKEFDLPSDFE